MLATISSPLRKKIFKLTPGGWVARWLGYWWLGAASKRLCNRVWLVAGGRQGLKIEKLLIVSGQVSNIKSVLILD